MSYVNNFDRVRREMEKRIKEISGEIPLDQLLTDDFMKRRTPFASFDDMIQQSGFQVKTPEDFQRILGAKWDGFPTWDHMVKAAYEEMAAKKFKF